MTNRISNFAPMVEPVVGTNTHVNVYGGTVKAAQCHDCPDVSDFYMVHDELWKQAFAHSPPRERHAKKCMADLTSWLGRPLTSREKLRVRQRFGVMLCLACLVNRLGRDLRIPEDLKRYADGSVLPINRPLIYAAKVAHKHL